MTGSQQKRLKVTTNLQLLKADDFKNKLDYDTIITIATATRTNTTPETEPTEQAEKSTQKISRQD